MKVEDTWAKVGQVVVEYLDSMSTGDKTTLKNLAKIVQERAGVKETGITSIISIVVRSYPGVSMEYGRFGGIYKGGRPLKEDNRKRCEKCNQIIREKK